MTFKTLTLFIGLFFLIYVNIWSDTKPKVSAGVIQSKVEKSVIQPKVEN